MRRAIADRKDNMQSDFQHMVGCLPIDNFVYSIHISPKFKYIYVETPKAGCSTIKKTLIRAELEDPEYQFENRPSLHRRDLSPLLDPAGVDDFPKLVASGDYLKFCFVRNPYTRLLSAYLDKFRRPTEQQAHFKQQTGLKGQISFADFVGAVCSQSAQEMDNHWRGQYFQTLQETISYDFVGHTETLERDLIAAGKRFSLDLRSYFEAERSHAQGADCRLKEYYTSDLISAVQSKFKEDFECFGYSFDLDKTAPVEGAH